jgi:hypothetical protein
VSELVLDKKEERIKEKHRERERERERGEILLFIRPFELSLNWKQIFSFPLFTSTPIAQIDATKQTFNKF